MSDEQSDPQASSAHSSNPSESIPPPDEPKTPAWLTLIGLGIFLVAIGWLAVRCGSETNPEIPAEGAAIPSAQPAAH